MGCRPFLIAALLVLTPQIADACSCLEMDVCQKFWTADAVFTGIVTGITWTENKTQRRSHTTIVVERGFRSASGQVVITSAFTSCHYNFMVGQRYLVYARRGPDGSLTSGACSGNKPLKDAEADLDYAERLPPPGSGGRIYGRVRRSEPDLLDRRKSRDNFPEGIAITLRDSSGTPFELRTDAHGRFEAAGLKPDKYSVSLDDPPATARVYYSPTTIDLNDRACVPVHISYQSNGRIAGRIVDASSQPVSGVWVSAFPSKFTTKQQYPEASLETKRTDADGRYEIGPLPPGEYHLGVNVEWAPRLESPYPPTYHPGVLTRAEAETITVREGEMRRANFVLPSTLTKVSVSGTVVFSDGMPAPNVDVHLVAGTVSGIASARTNAAGAFTLTGLSGSTYSVRASFYTSPEHNGSAQTTVSLADAPVTDLKLILKRNR